MHDGGPSICTRSQPGRDSVGRAESQYDEREVFHSCTRRSAASGTQQRTGSRGRAFGRSRRTRSYPDRCPCGSRPRGGPGRCCDRSGGCVRLRPRRSSRRRPRCVAAWPAVPREWHHPVGARSSATGRPIDSSCWRRVSGDYLAPGGRRSMRATGRLHDPCACASPRASGSPAGTGPCRRRRAWQLQSSIRPVVARRTPVSRQAVSERHFSVHRCDPERP